MLAQEGWRERPRIRPATPKVSVMSLKKSVAGLALLCAFLALAGSANAHAKLLQSSPAADSTVPAPKSIALTFSEKVAPAFSGFDLAMGEGMTMQMTTQVSDDGKTITGTPTGSFMAGTYKITWHAAAVDDGHRTEGSFTFTVK